MQNVITFSALLWLLVLSYLGHRLARATDENRGKREKEWTAILILAWVNVAGYPIFHWIREWFGL